jgi:hypothetical protein
MSFLALRERWPHHSQSCELTEASREVIWRERTRFMRQEKVTCSDQFSVHYPGNSRKTADLDCGKSADNESQGGWH